MATHTTTTPADELLDELLDVVVGGRDLSIVTRSSIPAAVEATPDPSRHAGLLTWVRCGGRGMPAFRVVPMLADLLDDLS